MKTQILQGLWVVLIQGQVLGVCTSIPVIVLERLPLLLVRRVPGSLYQSGSALGGQEQSEGGWCEPQRSVRRSWDRDAESWWKTQILCHLGRGKWAQARLLTLTLGRQLTLSEDPYLYACMGGGGLPAKMALVEDKGTRNTEWVSLAQRLQCTRQRSVVTFSPYFFTELLFTSFPAEDYSASLLSHRRHLIWHFYRTPYRSELLKPGAVETLKVQEPTETVWGIRIAAFFFSGKRACLGEAGWCQGQIPGHSLLADGPLGHVYPRLVAGTKGNDGVGRMEWGESICMKHNAQHVEIACVCYHRSWYWDYCPHHISMGCSLKAPIHIPASVPLLVGSLPCSLLSR